MENKRKKIPRREFLANLLFAGGALSVGALESQYGLIAKRDPKEGWEIPEDNESFGQVRAQEGWELPEDLMNSPATPPPNPPPPPRPPHPKGDVGPPIRGRVRMPPPGSIAPPRPPK